MLLELIAGLRFPDSGSITVNLKNCTNIEARHRPVGMLFQDYALFPHMSVFENIAYSLNLKKLTKEKVGKRVLELAEYFSIANLLKREVDGLSGGEKQRVALARAIATFEPTRFNPNEDASEPSAESRDINPSSAMPAAEWGIITGKSIIASKRPFKGNFFLARMYERGRAKIEAAAVASAEMASVRNILSPTSRSSRVANNSGAVTERNIPASGANRNKRITPPRKTKSEYV